MLHKVRRQARFEGAGILLQPERKAKPATALLDLFLGDLDGEPVERGLEHDLTGKPARRAAIENATEHAVFLSIGGRQL